MCGISGIIQDGKGNTRWKYDEFLKDYAIFGMVRGECSTGIFQLDKKQEFFYHKSRSSGYAFLHEREAAAIFNDSDACPFTVLHHRAATVGNISNMNAHPFQHYSSTKSKEPWRYVIGCHNGRFSNFKRDEDGKTFVVDSDWGMYQIWKHGAAKGVGMLEGDMAIVWAEEDGKLRFYCNGNREFHFAFVADENAMLFGSEAAMLHMTATRNGIKLEDPIFTPDSDLIMVIDPENPRAYEKLPVIKKPKPVPQIQHGPAARGPNSWPIPTGTKDAGGSSSRTTFQNQIIQFSEEVIREKLGCGYHQEVEFFPEFSKWANALGASSSVVGDCIFEATVNGKKEVPTHYAMMLAPPEQAIEAMKKASKNGTIKAKIIGLTNLIIPSAPKDACKFLCAVLSQPVIIEYGDDETATAEIVIENAVARQAEMALVGHGVDDQMAQLDRAMGITTVPGPSGILIPLSRFAELIKHGCACCGTDITTTDARMHKIMWKANSSGNDDPLCPSCSNNFEDSCGTVH